MTATRKVAEGAREAARDARDHAMAAESRTGDIISMLSTMSSADSATARKILELLAANTEAVMVQIQKVGALEQQVFAIGTLLGEVSEQIGRPLQAPKKAVAKKAAEKAPARKRPPRKSAATKQ